MRNEREALPQKARNLTDWDFSFLDCIARDPSPSLSKNGVQVDKETSQPEHSKIS